MFIVGVFTCSHLNLLSPTFRAYCIFVVLIFKNGFHRSLGHVMINCHSQTVNEMINSLDFLLMLIHVFFNQCPSILPLHCGAQPVTMTLRLPASVWKSFPSLLYYSPLKQVQSICFKIDVKEGNFHCLKLAKTISN